MVQRAADKKQTENDNFWEKLELTEDPYDNLEGLAQYIHNNVGSTGVYIGQLEPPRLEINDDANETAHMDMKNPEVVKFKFADSSHKELMNDKVLENTTGICHEVFSEEFTTANQEMDSLGDLLNV
jgi:hypothetical protein